MSWPDWLALGDRGARSRGGLMTNKVSTWGGDTSTTWGFDLFPTWEDYKALATEDCLPCSWGVRTGMGAAARGWF